MVSPNSSAASHRLGIGRWRSIAAVATSLRRAIPEILLYSIVLGYFSVLFVGATSLFHAGGQLFALSADPVQVGAWQPVWYVSLAVCCYLSVVYILGHVVWTLVGLVTAQCDLFPRQRLGVHVTAGDYPRLFQLIGEVSEAIGAPDLAEVRISPQAECYAFELRRFSARPRRTLILVLGLPQLLALSSDELRVILAHELAHFRLGDTRRGVFVYRFQQALRQLIDTRHRLSLWWADPLYWVSQACFWLFLCASLPFQRAQEFKADQVCASVYGGELTSQTLLKEWVVASQFQMASVSKRSVSKPSTHSVIANMCHELSDNGYDYLRKRLREEEQSSFWDSHPTMDARITAVGAFAETKTSPPTSCDDLDDFRSLETALAGESGSLS